MRIMRLLAVIAALSVILTGAIFADEEKLISMDFKSTSLRDVLKAFSIQSGLNFVASENVADKRLTLYLEKVTPEDALKKILEANKLTYELEPDSNIFIVKEYAPPAIPESRVETQTRIYRLKYARVITSSVGGGAGFGGLGTAPRTVSGIDKIIPKLLSKYGSFATDERTNSLIITDIPSQFEIIEDTISKLDVPTKQVMLEAELLEVSVSDLKRSGVEWGGGKGELFVMTGASRKTGFPFTESMLFGSAARGIGSTGAITEGSYSFSNLIGTLRLLVTQGNAKFLARPKVMVLDNESAVIKISENTAVGVTSTSVSTAGTVVATAERMETGISLKVTPQINEDDFITMFIEPSVTRPVASEFFPTQFVDPQVRGVSSVIRVKDEETIIIGGLLRTDYSKGTRKVPVLGDLPLVGSPFRDTSNQGKETELVILITPRVIKEFPKVEKEQEGKKDASSREDKIKEALWRLEKKSEK